MTFRVVETVPEAIGGVTTTGTVDPTARATSPATPTTVLAANAVTATTGIVARALTGGTVPAGTAVNDVASTIVTADSGEAIPVTALVASTVGAAVRIARIATVTATEPQIPGQKVPRTTIPPSRRTSNPRISMPRSAATCAV